MSEIESLRKIEDELIELSELANNIIQKANTENELDEIRISFLGKKGKLSNVLKNMGRLSSNERPIIGQKANILKIQLSKVIGYKSVDYLEGYMSKMAAGNTADAFHALSEGYGFIMSLQFTNDGNDAPYFTKAEVDGMLSKLSNFWNVNNSDLTSMVSQIKSKMSI